MSSSAASSSNSNTTKPKWTHQVFISCAAEEVDVEHFIVTLNFQLEMAGIRTCFDRVNLGRKQQEKSLQAIEGSMVSVVLFSENYAGSSWCLQELEKIIECHRAKGQVILPVFYGVDLWEVRKQSGKFGRVFEEMIKTTSVKEDTVLSWRRALAEAAFFPDCFVPSFSDVLGCQAFDEIREGVGNIVAAVRMMVDGKYLSRPRHPVGIDDHAEDVLDNLNYNSERSHLVGIWGKGGIGKTSIAKVIYNRICHNFECPRFLTNIKDIWQQDSGKDYLQKQLSDISNTTDMIMPSTEMGDSFYLKRALVVLDDVSQTDQLLSLCSNRKLFGLGSIILVTTREKNILDLLEFDLKYELEEMDSSKSLELFSWHAFKHLTPPDSLIKRSRKAISYCGGLPLALEVLGSLLLDRTTSEWKSVLKLLERNQSNAVPLKLSYDFLDDNEKKIFLEIGCSYIGMDRHNITQLLNGCGLAADNGISKLIERGLLKVDKNNKLEMHDLLRDMGREMNHFKPKSKWFHNIFLSFRGKDTRMSFVSHLCAALQNAGIEVYMDNKLERGENISSSLLQAIEGSKISIIIFSMNYANSSWCLQELEKIIECHRTIGQEVLPVFYGVEPSEVRRQIGPFGKELDGLVQRISATKDMIISWKRALTEAANLSGFSVNDYRTEVDLIDDILKTVTAKLDDDAYLFVADHPVGMQSRVQDMIHLLSGKSNEVCIVGILGMGGSGKTSIAKAIYNEINQNFHGKSFLANVRDVWDQDDGQVYLQEQLLSGILKTRRVKLHNIELGKTIIKESLCQKRALVVLDDVQNLDQLNALCGSREWFGQGSRLIITTRDEHLLNVLQVDNIYRMKELDESESLELFSWHAFKQATPVVDFIELSKRVVAYSGRLPLALEVLGSYLFGRKIDEWESSLRKLEIIPNDQIQKKLKLSYDGLSDQTLKDIFLDICCFFIGKERNYVTQILDGCGLHAEIGLAVLMERNLVKVDKNNKLEMHDLLKVMGREITREASPENPEERSRLWLHDDVVDVMTNNIATIAIKGLAFSLPKHNDVIFETKAFKKMKRLRLLQLGHIKLTGDFEYLSKDLHWLCWHGFPLRYIPGNFSLKKIVAIDLKYSNLQLFWKQPQFLDRLKILNLSHSHYLTQTPDFSRLPNLEKLMLKDCPQLTKVHSTIGDLKYLVLLNLKDCKSLSHLPRRIYKLKSLKSLILSGCSKIDKLEEDIIQMESLTSLVADNTAITQVPFSLVKSRSIKYVSLCGHQGLACDVFPSLILSLMSSRSNPVYKVFGSISSSLQSLSLSLSAKNHAELESRPSTSLITYKETPSLLDFQNSMHVTGSENITSSSSLQNLSLSLSAKNHAELESRSSTSLITCTETAPLIDFQNSMDVTVSENITSSFIIQAGECSTGIDIVADSISQGWANVGYSDGDYSFPSDIDPKWQNFKGEGSSVLLKVPNTGCKLKGMILRIIYSSSNINIASECDLLNVLMINYTKKTTIQPYKRDTTTSPKDEEWKELISNLEPGDEVEIVIVLGHQFTVKKTIAHLIYDELTNEKMTECSSVPNKIPI